MPTTSRLRFGAAGAHRHARMGGLLVLLSAASACDLLTGPDDPSPIEYRAEGLTVFEQSHEWSPVPITYLEASLLGVNVTDDSVGVSTASCILDLEAFRDSDSGPGSSPSWRLLARQTWPGSSEFACLELVSEQVLGPGDTIRLSTGAIPLAEILADSLPAGSYRFQVRMNNHVRRADAGRSEPFLVALGTITLPVSRYPLSTGSYARDGFLYEVEVSSGSGADEDDLVRLTVTHAFSRAGPLTRTLSLNCPVQIFGFKSSDERVRIPVPGPAWTWPHGRHLGCGDLTMPIRLEPGGVARFEYPLPRARYAQDGLKITDYFLMAIIEVDERPIRFAVDPS